MARPLVFVAILPLVGCNSIFGIPEATLAIDGGSGDGGADACTASCPVTGSSQLRVIDGAHPTGVLSPIDLSTTSIAALEVAADGTITSQQPGTGDATGHFTIPDVPLGEYYLQFGVGVYYVTSTRSFDQVQTVLGRRDATDVAAATLTFDLSKMTTSWQVGDNLQIFSDNNSANAYEVNEPGSSDFMPTLATGATSLANTIAWGSEYGPSAGQPQISAAAGDVLEVWHASTTTLVPGINAAILAEYDSDPTLEMGSGSNTVSAIFTSIVATEHVTFTWPAAAWAAVSAWPVAMSSTNMLVSDIPYTTAYGQPYYTTDMATLTIDPSVVTSNTPLTINYGNPESAAQEVGWEQTAVYGYLVADDGDPALPAEVGTSALFSMWPIAQITGTLAPLITPPQTISVTVGGVAEPLTTTVYNAPSTGTVISWTPPATGTPTDYQIDLSSLTLRPSRQSTTTLLATFHTTNTSLVVPTGFLVANRSYVLKVSASLNDDNAPPPFGNASYVPRAFRTGAAPVACGTSGAACCGMVDGVDVSSNPCNAGFNCDFTPAPVCEPCGALFQECCAHGDACNDGAICGEGGAPGICDN